MSEQGSSCNKRRRGRPPKEPEWLKPVAEAVGRGVPLRRALWREKVFGLTEPEIHNIYRWMRFRFYMETARINYFREYGRIPGRGQTRLGERMLAGRLTNSVENFLARET